MFFRKKERDIGLLQTGIRQSKVILSLLFTMTNKCYKNMNLCCYLVCWTKFFDFQPTYFLHRRLVVARFLLPSFVTPRRHHRPRRQTQTSVTSRRRHRRRRRTQTSTIQTILLRESTVRRRVTWIPSSRRKSLPASFRRWRRRRWRRLLLRAMTIHTFKSRKPLSEIL